MPWNSFACRLLSAPLHTEIQSNAVFQESLHAFVSQSLYKVCPGQVGLVKFNSRVTKAFIHAIRRKNGNSIPSSQFLCKFFFDHFCRSVLERIFRDKKKILQRLEKVVNCFFSRLAWIVRIKWKNKKIGGCFRQKWTDSIRANLTKRLVNFNSVTSKRTASFEKWNRSIKAPYKTLTEWVNYREGQEVK